MKTTINHAIARINHIISRSGTRIASVGIIALATIAIGAIIGSIIS